MTVASSRRWFLSYYNQKQRRAQDAVMSSTLPAQKTKLFFKGLFRRISFFPQQLYKTAYHAALLLSCWELPNNGLTYP
jgi:hypothetical protein